MGIKILIIDDDKKLQKLLKKYLLEYGFEIISLLRGQDAMATIKSEQPDIIILDIVLPDSNGLEILKLIRSSSSIPVIMLSAKGDKTDRILGLELGADDYLPKPFSSRELLARINAVLRRSNHEKQILSSEDTNHTICTGKITLDLNRQVLIKGKKEVSLTFTEFQILEAFMKRPNVVFSRDDLMNCARGNDYIAFDRTIDMHISRIRTKLNAFASSGCRIKTAWGSGYMFVVEK